MLQFNAIHYATPSGVLICYMGGPGVPPLTGLHRRATIWRPLPGLGNSARMDSCRRPAGYDEAATGKSN